MEENERVNGTEEIQNQDLKEISLEEQETIEHQTEEMQSISCNEKEEPKGVIINIKNRKTWPIIILIVIVLIVGIVVASREINKTKAPSITSTSDLTRILKISQLSTYKFAYNGIAKKTKNGKVVYYVSYNSIVKAGINLDKVKFKTDSAKKILYVTIPFAKIYNPVVDFKSQDPIFEDKSEDNRYTSIDAYPICEDDVKSETKKNKKYIIKTANKNARGIVKALLDPLAQQENYVVSVKSRRLK